MTKKWNKPSTWKNSWNIFNTLKVGSFFTYIYVEKTKQSVPPEYGEPYLLKGQGTIKNFENKKQWSLIYDNIILHQCFNRKT